MPYVKIISQRIDDAGDEVECEPFAVLDGEFTVEELGLIIERIRTKKTLHEC